MKKLLSLGVEGMETDNSTAWIWEPVADSDGFTGAIGRALDIWVEVWRKVGGQQFLPPRKAREGQVGK